MNEKTRRRWFSFSLRTLLVVVTLLCCFLAWQTSIVRERKAFLAELKGKSAYQITPAREWKSIYPPSVPLPPAAKITLVRRMLGDDAIQEIWITRYREGFAEADLDRIAKIIPEAKVVEHYPEPCHPGCFPRGTRVETASGMRLIESILPGDSIITILPNGESTLTAVQSVFITENQLWRVHTDDGDLITTKTQPLCLSSEKILQAGQLQVNDNILRRQDGIIRAVTVLSVTPTDRKEQVINLILDNSEVFVAEGFLARSKPPADLAASSTLLAP